MSNNAYHSGYEYFTPEPGTIEEKECPMCGQLMDVERNVNGPTGWAEAMGGGKHLHDVFKCPNAGVDWHNQIIALHKELNKTSSSKVAALLEEEIQEVKEKRQCTRKASGLFF